MITIKKLLYIFRHGYNPYFLYWFDLLTERHLKNRQGICINCIDCCIHYEWKCEHLDCTSKRCKSYSNRKCDEWFPISQKELELMKKWKPWMKCNFKFKK